MVNIVVSAPGGLANGPFTFPIELEFETKVFILVLLEDAVQHWRERHGDVQGDERTGCDQHQTQEREDLFL